MILVTGNQGFLGQALTKKLKEYLGFDVQDRFDITNREQLTKQMQDADAVVHLAGIVGESKCRQDVQKAFMVNSYGTLNVVQVADRLNIPKLVYASTCAVYGHRKNEIIDLQAYPSGVYTASKILAEGIVKAHFYKNIRFGSLYGGKGKTDSLPEYFLDKLSHEKLTVRNPSDWRPLTHVEDAADAIIHAIRYWSDRTVNVVGENMTKGALATMINKKTRGKISFETTSQHRSYKVATHINCLNKFDFKWTIERWLNEHSIMETV